MLELIGLVAGHPATLSAGVLVAAGIAGAVTSAQLRGIGLDDDSGGIAWGRVLALLVSWAVAAGGWSAVASLAGLGQVAGLLASGLSLVLSLVPPALILAGSSAYARGRLRGHKGDAETEVRWVQLGAGVLAALVVAQAAVFPAVLLIGAVVGGVYLARSPSARARLVRGWGELQAGQLLRRALPSDAKLLRDDRELELLGQVGLLDTVVMVGTELQTLPNTELLAIARRDGALQR